jgi:hypothetical protein
MNTDWEEEDWYDEYRDRRILEQTCLSCGSVVRDIVDFTTEAQDDPPP